VVKVDLKTHTTVDGADFYKVNPKGGVPALELEDGAILTEGAAILQYIADKAPEAALAPANGTLERYRVQEALNYLAADLHIGAFGPLWNPATVGDARVAAEAKLNTRLAYLDGVLNGKEYLCGAYSIADLYCYIQLTWAGYLKLDISQHKNITAYIARMAARPAAQAAAAAEYA
jgi:glutathione S-transferase